MNIRTRIWNTRRLFAALATISVMAAACASSEPSESGAAEVEADASPTNDDNTPADGGGSEEADDAADTGAGADDWTAVEEAAREEGKLTYYVAYYTQEQADELTTRFAEDYPDIELELVFHSNPSALSTRVSTEQEADQHVADIADVAVSMARQWTERGYTQTFIPPAAERPDGAWLFDPVAGDPLGSFTGVRVSFSPLWINTDLVSEDDAPSTHEDLLDPKWQGQIVWHAPWAAGTGTAELYFSTELYGDQWATDMQEHDVTFGTDYGSALNQVARGEYAIALGNPGGAGASALIEAGEPIRAVWLDDFTQGQAAGLALLNDAPHPNAGRVFINWMLTDSGQDFLRAVGHWHLQADIPQAAQWQQGVTIPEDRFDSNYGDGIKLATEELAADLYKRG